MTTLEYMQSMERWVEAGSHSGPNRSEKWAEYTALNLVRYRRVSKTYQMGEEMKLFLESGFCSGQHWTFVTESWCGDAVQSGPLVARWAEAAGAQLNWVLRDGDHAIIEDFLTDGGRSIPKWIVSDPEGRILATWGPRPSTAAGMVKAFRSRPEPKPLYSEFAAEVQLWYARNRGQEIENEALIMLRGI